MNHPSFSSFHGGHSGEFCFHAQGKLEETILSAIEQKISYLGVSEHAPRYTNDHLYEFEHEKNVKVSDLIKVFDEYGITAKNLQKKYQSEINLCVGFEAEYFPGQSNVMLDLRKRFQFDYMVGSVHYVDDIAIDFNQELLLGLKKKYGSMENLSLIYYDYLLTMIQELRPEVVAHIDLIKKFSVPLGYEETSKVKSKLDLIFKEIQKSNAVLDFNFSQPRRGRNFYYPSPWIIEQAIRHKIPICFGDDSHGPNEVCHGITEAKNYLLQQGVNKIMVFYMENQQLNRKNLSLL